MKSFNPLGSFTVQRSASRRRDHTRAGRQRLRICSSKFCFADFAVLLMMLVSLLGFKPTAQAHNLGQTDTSIAVDKATLELTAVRAGLNQLLLQPGDSVRQILKSTPAPAWFTGVGGLVTIQLCTRDS